MTSEAIGVTSAPRQWRKLKDEARRIGVGPQTLYRAAQSGELRVCVINARGDMRLLPEWTDAWLFSLQRRPIADTTLDVRRRQANDIE